MIAGLHPFRPETLADNSVVAPGPGVYPDVPMGTYHRWNAVSNSRLTKLDRSPAHLLAYLQEPPDDTKALAEGRAIHCAVLEPDFFPTRYTAGPDGDRRTKAVKEQWDALLGQYGEGYVLKPDRYDACMRIRDTVHAHPAIGTLLRRVYACELSIRWDGATSAGKPVPCKARFDAVTSFAGGAILDLKSTRDAALRAFERAIFSFGYHRQGAFYLDGAESVGIEAKHYIIIAQEKDVPYAAAAYRLREDALEAGRAELQRLLDRYRECSTTGIWPAYSDDVVDISLPAYAWERIDEKTLFQGA
jgi:exodeoxyribonuclease VIII